MDSGVTIAYGLPFSESDGPCFGLNGQGQRRVSYTSGSFGRCESVEATERDGDSILRQCQ